MICPRAQVVICIVTFPLIDIDGNLCLIVMGSVVSLFSAGRKRSIPLNQHTHHIPVTAIGISDTYSERKRTDICQKHIFDRIIPLFDPDDNAKSPARSSGPDRVSQSFFLPECSLNIALQSPSCRNRPQEQPLSVHPVKYFHP